MQKNWQRSARKCRQITRKHLLFVAQKTVKHSWSLTQSKQWMLGLYLPMVTYFMLLRRLVIMILSPLIWCKSMIQVRGDVARQLTIFTGEVHTCIWQQQREHILLVDDASISLIRGTADHEPQYCKRIGIKNWPIPHPCYMYVQACTGIFWLYLWCKTRSSVCIVP